MSLAVYVHIPYCLQRCRYCDFTTFEWREILPPEKYVAQVLTEIRARHGLWPNRDISTLYFGGGTPSLIAPEHIVAICQELAKVGFRFLDDAELTIEINPATLTQEKLNAYRHAGFNRFSVGAQTFNDRLLNVCGRKHSAADTRETLRLLKGLNYSFDLLFALPGQSTSDLEQDLDEVVALAPPHLSAYCLTVPEGHPMSRGRAPEEEQLEMFALLERRLVEAGLHRYEISNFARPGFESRHNQAYWTDVDYWGIGLSSHSYQRFLGPFGTRFWNPKSLADYAEQVTRPAGADYPSLLPPEQYEGLLVHEALTDFSHMHLRMERGLPKEALRQKFAAPLVEVVLKRLDRLTKAGLLEPARQAGWKLSQRGLLISNKVFEELTFLPEDLQPPRLTRSISDSYCAV